MSSSFDYAGHRDGDGWQNPAIAEIMVGPKMRNTMRRIGYQAQALYAGRAPRVTGRMASHVRVTTQLGSGNLGAKPDRWVAIVEAVTNYSAAVEFGKAQTAAKGHPRPKAKRRVTPGSFPARTQGAHTFGGDNRRDPRAIVAWIEGH
ncbi:hypothetical protein [Nocardia sp. NPDC050435]|uniref:hypothetical protein n=1 Tax=Nocardia sp. NPDC050435 TaxID=3155040 RepID=UPI0033CED20B